MVDETLIQDEDEDSDFSLTNFLLSWFVPEEETLEEEDIDPGFKFCSLPS